VFSQISLIICFPHFELPEDLLLDNNSIMPIYSKTAINLSLGAAATYWILHDDVSAGKELSV